MQDTANTFQHPLAGLSKADWLRKLASIVADHGVFTPIDNSHFSALMTGEEDNDTLLVTFESIGAIRGLTDAAQPLGWELNNSLGWAHLCFACEGDTWFRSQAMAEHLDTLVDEGLFDTFENILFYGAGPCAYAAAAYSVAAPGSTVLMVQPQATLDPRVSEWDDRFKSMRRTDFNSRYGYAPDMLDAAGAAFVIYDPAEQLDAMHAALFTKPHVTKLRMRHMGSAIQTHLMQMDILYRLLNKAGTGKLDTLSFAKLYRKRRTHPPYLRRVLNALDMQERFELSWMLSRNVTSRMTAPRFQRRLNELANTLGKSED